MPKYTLKGGVLWASRNLAGSYPSGDFMPYFQTLPTYGWKQGKKGIKFFGPYQTWNVQVCDACGEARYKRRRLAISFAKVSNNGEWFVWSRRYPGKVSDYSLPLAEPMLTCKCTLKVSKEGAVSLRSAGIDAGIAFAGLNAQDFLEKQTTENNRKYPNPTKRRSKTASKKASSSTGKRDSNRIGGAGTFVSTESRRLIDRNYGMAEEYFD